MKRVVTPTRCSQSRTAVAVNSGAVVGSQKRRRPALDEQLGQPRQDVVAAQSAGDVETQALAGVLIHDGEDPHRAPIGGAVEDEVVGPDVGRRSARRRTSEPAASQRRPRLGCFPGTRKPS